MSRAVMQEALEALEILDTVMQRSQRTEAAITALKQALAEPEQEPVCWQWLDTANYRKKLPADAIPEHWRPLYTSAPTPSKPLTTHWEGCEAVHPECKQPEPEPVAWMESPYGVIRANLLYRIKAPQSVAWSVPLYTAPTPRKPLTMEQLHGIREHQRLLEELGPVWAPMLYYFCQSIERAHGIGDSNGS